MSFHGSKAAKAALPLRTRFLFLFIFSVHFYVICVMLDIKKLDYTF